MKNETLLLIKALERYLDECAFRDFDIVGRNHFANPRSLVSRKIAVHQVVEATSIEDDVDNAIYNFQRDGFGSIVFYVEGVK